MWIYRQSFLSLEGLFYELLTSENLFLISNYYIIVLCVFHGRYCLTPRNEKLSVDEMWDWRVSNLFFCSSYNIIKRDYIGRARIICHHYMHYENWLDFFFDWFMLASLITKILFTEIYMREIIKLYHAMQCK